MRINKERIARAAVDLEMTGHDSNITMPDLEKEATDATDKEFDDALEGAWIDLDDAHNKRTKAHLDIAQWKEELAAAK